MTNTALAILIADRCAESAAWGMPITGMLFGSSRFMRNLCISLAAPMRVDYVPFNG